MSNKHDNKNNEKLVKPINIIKETTNMLRHSVRYIKSLAECLEQELNHIESAPLIKNKRRRELISEKDDIYESSKTLLESKNKTKNQHKYMLRSKQSKNQDSCKKECGNVENRNKCIKHPVELLKDKKEEFAMSFEEKDKKYDDVKLSVLRAIDEIKKINCLSKNKNSASKIPEINKNDNSKYSLESTEAYILI